LSSSWATEKTKGQRLSVSHGQKVGTATCFPLRGGYSKTEYALHRGNLCPRPATPTANRSATTKPRSKHSPPTSKPKKRSRPTSTRSANGSWPCPVGPSSYPHCTPPTTRVTRPKPPYQSQRGALHGTPGALSPFLRVFRSHPPPGFHTLWSVSPCTWM
jgi:hypothetical protein